MLSLSPAKILVVLVIMLIVLGPDKLPGMARQIGATWHDFRTWRSKLETEVRGTFPDLPPTQEVARVVRSPLAFLDRLAAEHERNLAEDGKGSDPASSPPPGTLTGPSPPSSDTPPANAGGNGWAAHLGVRDTRTTPQVAPDDPSMN